jgi:hypothetical protein
MNKLILASETSKLLYGTKCITIYISANNSVIMHEEGFEVKQILAHRAVIQNSSNILSIFQRFE